MISSPQYRHFTLTTDARLSRGLSSRLHPRSLYKWGNSYIDWATPCCGTWPPGLGKAGTRFPPRPGEPHSPGVAWGTREPGRPALELLAPYTQAKPFTLGLSTVKHWFRLAGVCILYIIQYYSSYFVRSKNCIVLYIGSEPDQGERQPDEPI